MNNNKIEKLLTSQEICDILAISYRRFLRYVHEDDTFPVRKIGGTWKVFPSDLRNWVDNQSISRGSNKPIRNRATRITTPPGGWKVNIPQ